MENWLAASGGKAVTRRIRDRPAKPSLFSCFLPFLTTLLKDRIAQALRDFEISSVNALSIKFADWRPFRDSHTVLM